MLRFGTFELDEEKAQLSRDGRPVKLAPQPFRLLLLLASRPGELVTRDEIRQQIWGGDTFVDFEQGVNFCVKQVRAVLRDDAERPLYVETLPRRGYRFIAPVQHTAERGNGSPTLHRPPSPIGLRRTLPRWAVIVSALLLIATAALAAGSLWKSRVLVTKPTCRANEDLELGRFFLEKTRKADTSTAIQHFEAAAKEDPNCAPAYAGLADAYNQLAGVFIAGEPPTNVRLLAIRAATRAIQLDPNLAQAYTALGYTAMHEFDWQQAERVLRRAIDLDPGYTRAHLVYANYLAAQRRFTEAVAEGRKALNLAPASLRVRQVFGWMLYFDRQYDAAIRELQTIVGMDQTFAIAQFHLGEALLVAGRFEQAISTLRSVVDLTERAPAPLGLLAMAYAGNDEGEEARRILADLEKRSTTETVPPGALLLAYIAVDDKPRAIDMLERGYAERDNYEIWIDADPLMDPLRNEPRYQAVCRQVMESLITNHSSCIPNPRILESWNRSISDKRLTSFLPRGR